MSKGESTATATHTVVIEREMHQPADKIWRALTDSTLMEQWIMSNDFKPVVGHRFTFRMPAQGNWSGVIDCEVLSVEPPRRLSYTWGTLGLETVVTFTLTPTAGGVTLRLEQSGFRSDTDAAYKGAQYGWQKFLGQLETVAGQVA